MTKSSFLLVFFLFFSMASLGQTADVKAKPLTADDIKILQADVQVSKDQIIKHTMEFTDAESAAFWPVYMEYAKAQHTIADKRLALITDYAHSLESMDNTKAHALTQQLFQIEDETLALRKSYFPKFEKALGAKRAAKFCQVDNRLSMIVNMQLAAEVPLVP